MAEALAAGGIFRVEPVMGIPVGIDVRDEGVDPRAVDRAFAHLRAVDATFSPYRASSAVSRLAAGALALADAPAEVRAVLARCERLRAATGGRFDVRATGRLDPSGFVKGWAVDGAVAILREEALRAGSADIDVVTGATYTSRSYRLALQSAIDRARGG